MSDLELDEIRDKKDKLISKLYMNKLHTLLEDDTKTLHKCNYCHNLFTQSQMDKFGCPKAKIFIDFHGKVIADHMFDRSFDIKKFISFCKNTMKLTWKQIYWKVYSHTVDFEWKTWNKRFNGAYSKHWYYHPNKAIFSFGSNKGVYQWWKQETLRFDTSIRNDGWMARSHVPKANDCVFLRLLELNRIEWTQEPYPAGIKDEEDDLDWESVKENKPHIVLISEMIKKYNKESNNTWMMEDEDEDENEPSTTVNRKASMSPNRKRFIPIRKGNSVSPNRTNKAGKNYNSKFSF